MDAATFAALFHGACRFRMDRVELGNLDCVVVMPRGEDVFLEPWRVKTFPH